jgi:hypothetical protein
MNSGDLVPSSQDRPEPADAEVQFALVIARMIDTVKNSPDDMRQAIYDLARYKLQEQFTYADAKDIRRTQQALESAIRGVEAFSKQNPSIGIAAPSPLAEIGDPDMAAPGQLIPQVRKRPRFGLGPEPRQLLMMSSRLPWPRLKRALVMFAVFGATLVAFQQRGRLATWVYDLQRYEKQSLVRLLAVLPTERNEVSGIAIGAMLSCKAEKSLRGRHDIAGPQGFIPESTARAD